VSQETVVFDDTVAGNIAMQLIDSTNLEQYLPDIEYAARQANLHDFIVGLPGAYLTEVGDRGVRLSGGQRQRLFIARELYRRPSLLILDEATSALDSESERAIQNSIEALHGRMTVVMIAHRLATVRAADLVVVLEQGRLVEKGTFNELRDRVEGRFRSMVDLQVL
jgi:ABC-type multidrug transport system fused ATPase/permease subunit